LCKHPPRRRPVAPRYGRTVPHETLSLTRMLQMNFRQQINRKKSLNQRCAPIGRCLYCPFSVVSARALNRHQHERNTTHKS
jgi:hypothetical protein